jgi:hypothetical protein
MSRFTWDAIDRHQFRIQAVAGALALTGLVVYWVVSELVGLVILWIACGALLLSTIADGATAVRIFRKRRRRHIEPDQPGASR